MNVSTSEATATTELREPLPVSIADEKDTDESTLAALPPLRIRVAHISDKNTYFTGRFYRLLQWASGNVIELGFPVKRVKFNEQGVGMGKRGAGWTIHPEDLARIPNPSLLHVEVEESKDLRYRYTYHCWWGPGPILVFILLNPSTATAKKLDATIRRCKALAKRLGMDGFFVVNLFAFRAKKVTALRLAEDPIGDPANALAIELALSHARRFGYLVLAWGSSIKFSARSKNAAFRERDKAVFELIRKGGPLLASQVLCLGINKDGAPEHPLYVADAAPLVQFDLPAPPTPPGPAVAPTKTRRPRAAKKEVAA